MIENLENRVLLTGTLSNGTLMLTSVALGESFVLTADPNNIIVDLFAEQFHAEYPRSAVQRIIITSIQAGTPGMRAGDFYSIDPTITVPVTVNGSVGDDVLIAGGGNTLFNPIENPPATAGNDGADFLQGGAGNDTLNGGGGRATATNGTITTPAADDTILGGDGNDFLTDGGSTDNAHLGAIMIGENGNDTLQSGPGRDLLDGGPGTDTLDYSTSAAANGINVVFPNGGPSAADPAFDMTMPITATNFPFLGFGAVTKTGNVYLVSEHDQLYQNLDTLPQNQLDYDDITASHTNLLNDDNVEIIIGSDGTDLVDVASKKRGLHDQHRRRGRFDFWRQRQ